MEDETGSANVIIWPKVFEQNRAGVIAARFLAVTGRLQNEAGVIHVVAERMEDLTPMLNALSHQGASDLGPRPGRRGQKAPDLRQPEPGSGQGSWAQARLSVRVGHARAKDHARRGAFSGAECAARHAQGRNFQ